MAYNPAIEKIKAMDFVSHSLAMESAYKQYEKVKRAIAIALDELREFEEKYNHFIESVSHLQVFQELLRPIHVEYTNDLLHKSKDLMERTYTDKELEGLPLDVYNNIVELQKKRVNVLKKIASVYMLQ